jgi:hypothetical protein
VAAYALEAGHHQHVELLQQVHEPGLVDLQDARPAVVVVGQDGDLEPEHRAAFDAGVLEQHGEQGHRDLLPGGHQGVAFGRVRVGREFPGQA